MPILVFIILVFSYFIFLNIIFLSINGLLSHQEDKQKCEIIHNRDKNAVQNMLNIVKNIFTIGKDLTYLREFIHSTRYVITKFLLI